MRLAGVQPWLKSWGQGLGPNTGALAPHPWPKAGLGVGCGGGHPLPLLGSGGIIFENSVAKSCILVTACCEISCFFENYGQEVGGPMHCWSLQPKSWGPVFPGPCGCCAYGGLRKRVISEDEVGAVRIWICHKFLLHDVTKHGT